MPTRTQISAVISEGALFDEQNKPVHLSRFVLPPPGWQGLGWQQLGREERARQGSQQMAEAHTFHVCTARWRPIQRPPPDRRSCISAGR